MYYSTHSKKEVLDFFSMSPHSSYSLNDLIKELPELPKSSIYRIVDSLESEKKIMKVGTNKTRSALYQLCDENTCPRHMHIRCIKCGKTEHLDEKTSLEIEKRIEERVGYAVLFSTVFDGLCSECKKKEREWLY